MMSWLLLWAIVVVGYLTCEVLTRLLSRWLMKIGPNYFDQRAYIRYLERKLRRYEQ